MSGLTGVELGRVRDAVLDPLPSLEDFVGASLRARCAAAAATAVPPPAAAPEGPASTVAATAAGAGGSQNVLAQRLSGVLLKDAPSAAEALGLEALLRLGPAAAARADSAAANTAAAAAARTHDLGSVDEAPPGPAGVFGRDLQASERVLDDLAALAANVRWVLRPADQGAAGASHPAARPGFGPDPWLRRRDEAGGPRVYLAGGRGSGAAGPRAGAGAVRLVAETSASSAHGADVGGAARAPQGDAQSTVAPLTATDEIARCVQSRTISLSRQLGTTSLLVCRQNIKNEAFA